MNQLTRGPLPSMVLIKNSMHGLSLPEHALLIRLYLLHKSIDVPNSHRPTGSSTFSEILI